jgi:hypothetical protein
MINLNAITLENELNPVPNEERRATGSYYTPSPLVQTILDKTLEPLIAKELKEHPENPTQALLNLTIMDPSCGSGNFLLAALRRLAEHIIQLGTCSYHEALKQAASCIYGIDLNPSAVEICKMSLGAETGLPPTFFDSHILQGNALLDATENTSDNKQQYLPWFKPEDHQFLHWCLAFPQVYGGFDLIIGNPPWIAYAGRAAQPLDKELKSFYQANYESFANYPTTHGMFITAAAKNLKLNGYLGFIIPSSVSELDGYLPTRLAHDKLCDFPEELIDFGEHKFPGITQPCMALVSKKSESGRSTPGAPWPIQRPDLNDTARNLIARLSSLPPLPPELFGERGIQSDKSVVNHIYKDPPPNVQSIPLREGKDIKEFQLLPPRLYIDYDIISHRIQKFKDVSIVIRQTAKYPIAALSDGIAFRNSLLAAFESNKWPTTSLVALLNSSLIRWLHYMRFREARQPILPQIKISHLRAIPQPPQEDRNTLCEFGRQLTEKYDPEVKALLDQKVFNLFDLSKTEQEVILSWHK